MKNAEDYPSIVDTPCSGLVFGQMRFKRPQAASERQDGSLITISSV
jgi:hypothetical protein